MQVPFLDLRTQYHSLKEEIDKKVLEVIDSTAYILGPEVQEFEKEFAEFIGAKYAIGVGSGTDALIVALRALGITTGDEVITVANTYIATAVAISAVGAKPVLVDIEAESYNIDPSKIERAITSRTKAIIAVHLYGQAADMDPIMEIAKRNNLYVIEDACQAHGTKYKGKNVGTIGDIAAFSFYPGKNLGAYGDGGIVVTNSDELAEIVNLNRTHGQKKKYYHEIVALNSRLDSLQAAILRIKLKHLSKWNEMRYNNAQLYTKLLADVPEVITPTQMIYSTHIYHLYVVRVSGRAKLQDFLNKNNIQTGIHYPIPIHLTDAYKSLGYGPGSFPITEEYANQILSLPMFPELTEEQIAYVVEKIKEFYRK